MQPATASASETPDTLVDTLIVHPAGSAHTENPRNRGHARPCRRLPSTLTHVSAGSLPHSSQLPVWVFSFSDCCH